jgi:hypothetical protein
MIIHSRIDAASDGAVGIDLTFSGTMLCRVSPATFADAAKSLSLEVDKHGSVTAVGTTGWWTVAKEMGARGAKVASKRLGKKLDLFQAKTPGYYEDENGDRKYPGGKRLDIRSYDGRASKASVIGSLWVDTQDRKILAEHGIVPLDIYAEIQKAATDGDVYERRACGRLISTGIARLGGRPICLHKRSGRYFVPVKYAERVLGALNALVACSRGEFTYMATSIFPNPAHVAPVMTGTILDMETRIQEEVDYFQGIDWYQPRQANAAKRHFEALKEEFAAYESQMTMLLDSVETSHAGWAASIKPHLESWGEWANEALETLGSATKHNYFRGGVPEAPSSPAQAAQAAREAEAAEIAAREVEVEELSWDDPAPEEEAAGGANAVSPESDGIDW